MIGISLFMMQSAAIHFIQEPRNWIWVLFISPSLYLQYFLAMRLADWLGDKEIISTAQAVGFGVAVTEIVFLMGALLGGLTSALISLSTGGHEFLIFLLGPIGALVMIGGPFALLIGIAYGFAVAKHKRAAR